MCYNVYMGKEGSCWKRFYTPRFEGGRVRSVLSALCIKKDCAADQRTISGASAASRHTWGMVRCAARRWKPRRMPAPSWSTRELRLSMEARWSQGTAAFRMTCSGMEKGAGEQIVAGRRLR